MTDSGGKQSSSLFPSPSSPSFDQRLSSSSNSLSSCLHAKCWGYRHAPQHLVFSQGVSMWGYLNHGGIQRQDALLCQICGQIVLKRKRWQVGLDIPSPRPVKAEFKIILLHTRLEANLTYMSNVLSKNQQRQNIQYHSPTKKETRKAGAGAWECLSDCGTVLPKVTMTGVTGPSG